MANLTGVSVRTIQYYDKIGLLHPSARSKTGYRLYNDGKIFQLQQILFYKEAGLTLKEIQKNISSQTFDHEQELIKQKILLIEKKQKIEKMIKQIDLILGGTLNMDFESYKKTLALKIPNNTSQADRESILNAITPDQLETIQEVWGIDKFFDFLNSDSPMRKDMNSFIQKGNQLVESVLHTSDPQQQTQLITEWMLLISEYTQLDFKTVVSSMRESYLSHQLTIDSVNAKFGTNTNQKLAKLLGDYEKHLA